MCWNPGGVARFFGIGGNLMRGLASEKAYSIARGSRPRRANPKNGTEMK
jgi:hypothetical protein